MGTYTWKVNQIVYWKRKEIDRHDIEYQELIRGAYKTKFEQNQSFHDALMLTDFVIVQEHAIHAKTILTEHELCTVLTELRDGVAQKKECISLCSRESCPFIKSKSYVK